jgi:hypothetical protein
MTERHHRRPTRESAKPTPDQQAELDRRLDAYATDGNRGRMAADVIADVRRKLLRA